MIIELTRSMNVTRIETQGRALSSEFVREFTVSYGTNGYDYVDYKDISGTKKVCSTLFFLKINMHFVLRHMR